MNNAPGRTTKMKNKLLVMAGYKCNNNCIFCSANSGENYKCNRSTKEIVDEMNKNKVYNQDIEFIGGEFTIRNDAVYLVKTAKKIGYNKISIETNGRRFAYDDFCERIIKAGLNKILFSIHGATPKTHDKITRVNGSFSQAIKGLNNLEKKKVYFSTNFVITKYNYKEIPEFVEKVNKYSHMKKIIFSFVRPMSFINQNDLVRMVPKYSEIIPILKKVEENKKVKFNYIPFCLINKNNIVSQDTKKNINKNYGNYEIESNLYKSLKKEFMFLDICKKCEHKDKCLGILKNYYKIHGNDIG